jgi:hypothetical protein
MIVWSTVMYIADSYINNVLVPVIWMLGMCGIVLMPLVFGTRRRYVDSDYSAETSLRNIEAMTVLNTIDRISKE